MDPDVGFDPLGVLLLQSLQARLRFLNGTEGVPAVGDAVAGLGWLRNGIVRDIGNMDCQPVLFAAHLHPAAMIDDASVEEVELARFRPDGDYHLLIGRAGDGGRAHVATLL